MSETLLFPFAEILANETSLVGPDAMPADLVSALDGVWYYDFARSSDSGVERLWFTLVVDSQLAISAPGLPSLKLVFAGGGGGTTELNVRFSITAQLTASLEFEGVTIALRFPPEWLRPMRGDTREVAQGFSELTLTGDFTISRDRDLQIDFVPRGGLSLPRSMIADTGVIVSASGIDVRLSGEDRGVYLREAKIELPPDIAGLPDITLSDCAINADGFSGSISAEWNVATLNNGKQIDETRTEVVASIFDPDFKIAARSISVRFEKNRLTEFALRGLLQFPPSVLDSVAEAEISLTDSGDVLVALRGIGPDGLLTLGKADYFAFKVNGFSFKRTHEETAFTVDGDLSFPRLQALAAIGLQGFSVYKEGSDPWAFRLEGGTVKINKSIDLSVARVDINEIGVVKREGERVVTFSGGVQLLEGIDAGAWVKGLRIPIDNPKDMDFDGIGLRVVVPDSFEFQGSVLRPPGQNFFEGSIALTIIPVEIGIGAEIKVGRGVCRFAYIAAQVTIPPPGIPLASLPLYIRGFSGLMGVNVAPNAKDIHEYFPLATQAPPGLIHASKWIEAPDKYAIGVGMDVATANPKLFWLSSILAFLYPQRVLLIEGQAFVLETPSPGKEPPFHSLMVFDLREPMALINIGAKYEFVKGVLNAEGVAEASFGGGTSYLALGFQDRPIKAKVLQLFQARSYLVLKPAVWTMGASIGLPKKRYDLGPLTVHFDAAMNGDGTMHWGPEQLNGGLNLKGSVGFRVFKKGFDLGLRSHVIGKAPDWLIDASLAFGVKVKVLCKTFEFEGEVPFHWERRHKPRVPRLLREVVAAQAESRKTTSLTLRDQTPNPAVLADFAEIEADSVLALGFAYPMKDLTGLPFGQDLGSVRPHRSGDYTFTAILQGESDRGIRLYRKALSDASASWAAQFLDRPGPNANDPPPLLGTWQADQAPDGTQNAIHLHLFARTPFEYNRPSRLSRARADTVARLEPVPSTVPGTSASDPATMLANSGPALAPVAYTASLRPISDVAASGVNAPLRAFQYAAREAPSYPHTPAAVLQTECRNFLDATVKPYAALEALHMNGTPGGRKTPAHHIRLSGYAVDPSTGALVGDLAVVEDASPYPLRYLTVTVPTRPLATGAVIPGQAELLIALPRPVSSLSLHCGPAKETAPFTLFNVYKSANDDDAKLWSFPSAMLAQATFAWQPGGEARIAVVAGGAPFRLVRLRAIASCRVYSLCFFEDEGEDRKRAGDRLKAFVDLAWREKPSGGGASVPGPVALVDEADVPGGGLLPGYKYLLEVRTTHVREGPGSDATRYDTHYVGFKISRPPSSLLPYVATAFPSDAGFPHYRSGEVYVRFARNHVHKLIGDFTGRIRARVSRAEEELASLPYLEQTSLAAHRSDASSGRLGWGLGKADGHTLTREEELWLQAYNRGVPAAEQITSGNLVPDDVLWAYGPNPLLLRLAFDAASGSLMQRRPALSPGETDLWRIEHDLLRHDAGGSGAGVSAQLGTVRLEEPYQLSLRVRPRAATGAFAILLNQRADDGGLALRFDLAAARVQLWRRAGADGSGATIIADRPVSLPAGAWSLLRVSARISATAAGDKLRIGLAHFDAAVLSVDTDAGRISGQAGIEATGDFNGEFDDLEIVGTRRLIGLPRPGERHDLTLVYTDDGGARTELLRTAFLASTYLGLWEHLSSWDRVVLQAPQPVAGAAVSGTVLAGIQTWLAASAAVRDGVGRRALAESQCRANNWTLGDVQAEQAELQQLRYNLDQAFADLRRTMGLEIDAPAAGVEVWRSSEGYGLLLRSAEPIAWSRIGAGRPIPVVNGVSGQPLDAQLVANSDFTEAMLFLRGVEAQSYPLLRFDAGTTYLWPLRQFDVLPAELAWLGGWLAPETYVMRLEV